MIAGQATAKYVRTSAQKAGLVLALIRGGDVKLAAAFGALALPLVAAYALFYGFVAGFVVAVVVMTPSWRCVTSPSRVSV